MTAVIKGDLVQMCPQCGADWTLTEAERQKLFAAGISVPKRCSDCRTENKKEGA